MQETSYSSSLAVSRTLCTGLPVYQETLSGQQKCCVPAAAAAWVRLLLVTVSADLPSSNAIAPPLVRRCTCSVLCQCSPQACKPLLLQATCSAAA